MKLDALLIHLQSWAQAELANQASLRDVITRLEAAVRDGKAERLLESGASLESALAGNTERERQRRTLMELFAAEWDVPAETLSLTSILDRADDAGADVTRLRALRDELRVEVRAVAKRAKLLAVMASHHRGVLQEIMTLLGASALNADARQAGVLVDAEA